MRQLYIRSLDELMELFGFVHEPRLPDPNTGLRRCILEPPLNPGASVLGESSEDYTASSAREVWECEMVEVRFGDRKLKAWRRIR